MANRFCSSTPLGRAAVARRSWMMYVALQMIASVSATCAAISSGAVLLRIMAERIGRISMVLSLLALELQGGHDLAGTPRRQHAGAERREHRQHDRGQQQRRVH